MTTITPTTAAPTTAAAAPKPTAKIQQAAQDFEALALGQMLAPMFQTVDTSKGKFGGGDGEAAWKPLLVTELGKQVAKGGGIGLARPIMEQMLRLQETQAAAGVEPGSSASGAGASGRGAAEQTQVERMLLERPALRRTTAQQRPGPGA